MRIALVQQRASDNQQENIERGLGALEKAASEGAELVCFAELAFDKFYPQYPAKPGFEDLAQPIPGPITDAFIEAAKRLKTVVILNLFERDGGRCYDTSPVIDADGTLVGKTRMVHITEYTCFHEQGYYTPGDTGAPVFDTAVGRIGVAICYDRHYPEYLRALALNNADLVVIPQAGAVGEWPDGVYEAELQVAAFQNGFFTALCNRVGIEDQLTFAGASFVCAPDGRIMAQAGSDVEQLLFADIDLQEVKASFARRRFLKDRRPNLYANWLAR